jgi:hypothetical protein
MIVEAQMERVPKAWMFTLGLSVLAVAAALMASTVQPSLDRSAAITEAEAEAQIESCFRYGRLECCLKPDGS